MRIIFIRHAMTYGNTLKRYIGRTDEDLCRQGISELNGMIHENSYPDCDIVVASPMFRCRRTAQIIYPDKQMIYEEDFAECNFGRFEGKNYIELNGDKDYQEWIDSGGELPFPEGEDIRGFKARCISGFKRTIKASPDKATIAFVVHGGTIMAIMEEFEENHRGYYEYYLANCEGYVAELDNGVLRIIKCIKIKG